MKEIKIIITLESEAPVDAAITDAKIEKENTGEVEDNLMSAQGNLTTASTGAGSAHTVKIGDSVVRDLTNQNHGNTGRSVNGQPPIIQKVRKFHFKTELQLAKWINDKTKGLGLEEEQQKRSCLVHVIKKHCHLIVYYISAAYKYLLDYLIQYSCLHEEEYQFIADQRVGRVNQMRCLVVIILGKDYRSILVFLKFILENNTDIHKEISHFGDMKVDNVVEMKCTLCVMGQRVIMSLLIDGLFSKQLIDTDFYSETSQCSIVGRQQRALWGKLSHQVSIEGNYEEMARAIVEAVEKLGFYSDIAQMLRLDIKAKENSFQCKCGPKMNVLEADVNERDDTTEVDSLPEDGYAAMEYIGDESDLGVPFVEPPFPDGGLVWPENPAGDKGDEPVSPHLYDMYDCDLATGKTENFFRQSLDGHNTGGED